MLSAEEDKQLHCTTTGVADEGYTVDMSPALSISVPSVPRTFYSSYSHSIHWKRGNAFFPSHL